MKHYRILLCGSLALLLPAAATAQGLNIVPPRVDTSQLATKDEVAVVRQSTCPPGTATPQAEAVQASAGSATTCLRSDAKLPRITRAGVTAVTDSTGNWSISWQMPLADAPLALPVPMNSGTQPIVCNVATTTMTGATGRCWLARTLPATIVSVTTLLTFDVFGTSAPGISVQVFAIPRTQ